MNLNWREKTAASDGDYETNLRNCDAHKRGETSLFLTSNIEGCRGGSVG